MYKVKIKGEDPIELNDHDGEIVAKAHEKYGLSRQDTFLKLSTWQGHASSISTIKIHRQEVASDNDYEKELRELSREEKELLKQSPEERAKHFSRHYYRFFHHAWTGKQATDDDMALIASKLPLWMQENPKRLIPPSSVLKEHLGHPTASPLPKMCLWGFYVNALVRDENQVKWR